MTVYAPNIAAKAKAGQFVMVIAKENSERIPLTISDTNISEGTITLVFQEIGFSTKELGKLKEGEYVEHILGPLGNPSDVEKFGTVICVAGGIGIAELIPIAKTMKEAGNRVIGILGARSKDLIIFEDKLQKLCDELFISTDDGSYGRKGLVTDILDDFLRTYPTIDCRIGSKTIEKSTHTKYPELVYAVGPVVMMEAVSKLTKNYNIKTIVSLNPIMVDATGMCGSCRVTVGGQIKFGCVDGPEFDGHLVDFSELKDRLNLFREKEECINKRCPKNKKDENPEAKTKS